MKTIQNYTLGYVPGKCFNLNKVQVRDAEISVGEGNTRSPSFPAIFRRDKARVGW